MSARSVPSTSLLAVALVALVAAAYSGVAACGFVSLDDSSHVLENEVVRGGLTWAGILRTFTEPHASLFVPLTTLSFMADVSLFGLNPAAMHLENVAWHAAGAVLLFLALREMTGRVWPSALVAALFGVHPVNVESVAWITERKNVLCGFWSLLMLWCWAIYARRGKTSAWLAAHAAFALALLAKPMAVPLPAALLLLDVWPLRRWGAVRWQRLVVEKVALFAMALTVSRLALWATVPRGSLVGFDELPLAPRVTNALTACAAYLGQLVFPRGFAVIYPHPVEAQWLPALAALALLLAITGAAWWARKTHPWWLPCWLFFLGMLVPTLGLVQVGSLGRADRFTYLAQIGLFAALVWSADAWLKSQRVRVAAAAALLVVLTSRTVAEVPVWTNSFTLYEHALTVAGPNPHTLDLLAAAHARRGDDARAIRCWRASLALLDDNAGTWNSLGSALVRKGADAEAIECFRQAVRHDPRFAIAMFNLAFALDRAGDREAAEHRYRECVSIDPSIAQAHYRLALILEADGALDAARAELAKALQLRPDDPLLIQTRARLEKAVRD